jgi:hypothetical protein
MITEPAGGCDALWMPLMDRLCVPQVTGRQLNEVVLNNVSRHRSIGRLSLHC